MAAVAGDKVSRILEAAEPGDPSAADQLLPLVYDELRALAHQRMANEPPGQTMQTTALVHEAYLRLVGDPDLRWANRAHFFAAAAKAIRRILVDRARRRRAVKHGGGRARVSLDQLEVTCDDTGPIGPEDFVALDEALHRLDRIDPRKAQIVMLRYFAGLTIEDTAQALGLSRTTIKDQWQFARAWLYREMTRNDRSKA